MPEPKYVIAMGACAASGGMFYDSYSVIQGIDSIYPLTYTCRAVPKPEALIDALIKLKKKANKNRINPGRKRRLNDTLQHAFR